MSSAGEGPQGIAGPRSIAGTRVFFDGRLGSTIPMQNKKRLRKRNLVQPSLQLRLIAQFAGLALIGVMLQFILFAYKLPDIVRGVETNGELIDSIPSVLWRLSIQSLLVLFPILVGFGVLFTFRIAGPVYHFEQYLAAVARGEQAEPCTLRRHDELKGLCERINEATAPLREGVVQGGDDSPGERPRENAEEHSAVPAEGPAEGPADAA